MQMSKRIQFSDNVWDWVRECLMNNLSDYDDDPNNMLSKKEAEDLYNRLLEM